MMTKSSLRIFFILMFSPILMALTVGDKLPHDLGAKNQNGKMIHLSDYRGKFVLLYFYPKDDTPGCTAEASGLRDQYAKIQNLNGLVLGVSRQDEKSHQDFIHKYQLPFDLLVDSDGALGKQFSVGTVPILGFHKRQSVLIGPDGKIIHFYGDVEPSKHAQEVISDIEKATPKQP